MNDYYLFDYNNLDMEDNRVYIKYINFDEYFKIMKDDDENIWEDITDSFEISIKNEKV